MKVLPIVAVALATAVLAVNCQDVGNGTQPEVQINPDGNVITNYTGQVQRLKQIGDMVPSLFARSRWCKSRGGRCRRWDSGCRDGYQSSPFGRPYCTSKKRKCCYPDISTEGPTTITPGPTVSPNITWENACSERFVRFGQKMNWTDARNLCMSYGLDLYQPKDCYCVSKYLEENFDERYQWTWLGARANGTHMIWLSGDVLETGDACWYHSAGGYNFHRGTDACLWMLSNDGWAASGEGVYNTQDNSCKRTSFYVLCG